MVWSSSSQYSLGLTGASWAFETSDNVLGVDGPVSHHDCVDSIDKLLRANSRCLRFSPCGCVCCRLAASTEHKQSRRDDARRALRKGCDR